MLGAIFNAKKQLSFKTSAEALKNIHEIVNQPTLRNAAVLKMNIATLKNRISSSIFSSIFWKILTEIESKNFFFFKKVTERNWTEREKCDFIWKKPPLIFLAFLWTLMVQLWVSSSSWRCQKVFGQKKWRLQPRKEEKVKWCCHKKICWGWFVELKSSTCL